MSNARRVTRPWFVLPLSLCWPAPARAQSADAAPSTAAAAAAEEAVRFQYTAPGDCPNAESFAAQVRKRTARGRLADPGELARTFTVKLSPDAKGFWGSIELLDDAGTKVARHLHGEQCEAVVSSLALITALALDATLRQAEETSSAPSAPQAPLPPLPVTRNAAAAPLPPPPKAAERRRPHARVGVSGGYDGSIHALPFALLGQLDWRSGFALRLAAHYAKDDFVVDSGRSAELRQAGLETSACPWRLATGALALAPCLAFDLGTLRVQGLKADKLTSASAKTILWAGVGAELRLAWEPESPVWIELHGRAEFPLISHQFRFIHPDAVVLTVPRFSGAAGVAAGVRF